MTDQTTHREFLRHSPETAAVLAAATRGRCGANPPYFTQESVDTGRGRLQSVQSMRPYYFDEAQQPVQRPVEAQVHNGRVEITVPEFRYHTMVVFRFEKGK
jgi:hypothetical protein